MKESWIIDQLVQQGVEDVCIAPGSRSTPLVMAAINHKKAKLHTHFDERGLGFFALGIAKAQRTPAAVIVTSGTAVGNLLPAVMEAHHSNIPLILLTADRPSELRDCSANQATDQTKIYQSFIRWQTDLPSELNERYFRSIVADGFFHSIANPPGPVHFNCPFRDPLYNPEMGVVEGTSIQSLVGRMCAQKVKTNHAKGLILIGKLPNPDDVLPILELAERLLWPVCADIQSNARPYPTVEQIKYYDFIEKPKPEIVLHFGERMTSKKVLEWLKQIRVEYIHISPFSRLQDPERILTTRVQSDIPEFCQSFEGISDPNWLDQWVDQAPSFEEGDAFTEVHMMQKLSALIPQDYAVFLGNGMPIRDADHFLFPEECAGFYANRGVSGIDGNIACIAGMAERTPILGIIGDQAALYDINSLPLLKNTKHPVVLLISNNFGGGVFHHLPVSSSPYFEQFWAAEHNMTFEKAREFVEFPYFSFDQIHKVFKAKLTAVVELITDRTANYEYQKSVSCLASKR